MHICEFCNREYRFISRLDKHSITCMLRPNKQTKRGNQYTKALELGLPKPIAKQHIWTEEEKKQHREKSIVSNANYWGIPENKEKHSNRMKQVIIDNPDSYSKNNVSGRVKMYDVIDSNGPTKVKGTWELSVANWLQENSIKWTNKVTPYSYFWNGSNHMYFPDFYLIDLNILIEVKGYETERDRIKWSSVTDKQFIVLREADIKNLHILHELLRGCKCSSSLISSDF